MSPLVSSRIVEGARLLRENKEVRPSAAEIEAPLATVYEALFREVPGALKPHLEAALAVYAAKKVPTGDFAFDRDLFEEALELVAG